MEHTSRFNRFCQGHQNREKLKINMDQQALSGLELMLVVPYNDVGSNRKKERKKERKKHERKKERKKHERIIERNIEKAKKQRNK